MLNIHQKFCRETFYDGKLVDFKPVYQDNFNFAYDVIDVIAQAEPETARNALVQRQGRGAYLYLFRPGKYSNRAANLFTKLESAEGTQWC